MKLQLYFVVVFFQTLKQSIIKLDNQTEIKKKKRKEMLDEIGYIVVVELPKATILRKKTLEF